MSVNVGTIDRLFRALLGIVLIAVPLLSTSGIWADPLYKYVAIAIGAVMLVVAATRVCPVYSIFGIRTCKA